MTRDDLAIEHETAFAHSFMIRARRDRFLSQLASPGKRRRFLDRLNHRFHKDLDSRWTRGSLPPSIQSDDTPCYIIACEDEFDGRVVPASDTARIMSAACFGMVVSFVPGHLAAYNNEAPAEVLWLQRPQTADRRDVLP